MTIHETLTRLATDLEALSVVHLGTHSTQCPTLHRIACELRELAKNTAIPETSEKSFPKRVIVYCTNDRWCYYSPIGTRNKHKGRQAMIQNENAITAEAFEELQADVETSDARDALSSLQDAESCETFEDFKANLEAAEENLKLALAHVKALRKQVAKLKSDSVCE